MNTDDICGNDGHNWTQTMDAQAWVTAWIRITAEQPEIAKDPGDMLGWFANSIMAGYDEAERRARVRAEGTLSPSEAVYGLVGWLTSRREPVTMSATHDAGLPAHLAGEFCVRHELPEPREDWATLLRYEDHACETCGGAGTMPLITDVKTLTYEIVDCPCCHGQQSGDDDGRR